MGMFVDYIRSTQLYKDLCVLTDSPHGNLLERVSDETVEAQTEFLRWALKLSGPRTIIETGTNKGMFGCFLAETMPMVRLHTFDLWPDAAQAAARVGQEIFVEFHLGDSRKTLSEFSGHAGFAWIDGDHTGDGPLCDLTNCHRLRIPLVAVDDVNEPDVEAAVNRVVSDSLYQIVGNPFRQHDKRRAILLGLV